LYPNRHDKQQHHQQPQSFSGCGDGVMRFTISSEEKLAMDVMPTGVVIHRPQGPRGGRMSVIPVRNEDIPFLAKALQQVLNANREVESI
jgi:hypothetical protein